MTTKVNNYLDRSIPLEELPSFENLIRNGTYSDLAFAFDLIISRVKELSHEKR